MGEHGESESFFGLRGDAVIVGDADGEVREESGELGHEERILRAAAGDDEVVELGVGWGEAGDGVGDGDGGEHGGGVDQVVW